MVAAAPDGTGTWNSGTTGDITGDSVADYDVGLERAGPGRADVTNLTNFLSCDNSTYLTLKFTARDRTVLIEDVMNAQCLIESGLASDMTGTTLRIRPLPPRT